MAVTKYNPGDLKDNCGFCCISWARDQLGIKGLTGMRQYLGPRDRKDFYNAEDLYQLTLKSLNFKPADNLGRELIFPLAPGNEEPPPYGNYEALGKGNLSVYTITRVASRFDLNCNAENDLMQEYTEYYFQMGLLPDRMKANQNSSTSKFLHFSRVKYERKLEEAENAEMDPRRRGRLRVPPRVPEESEILKYHLSAFLGENDMTHWIVGLWIPYHYVGLTIDQMGNITVTDPQSGFKGDALQYPSLREYRPPGDKKLNYFMRVEPA
jgi:hypothetical protein